MKNQLSILLAICGLVTVIDSAFGQTWTPTGLPADAQWSCFASSADGKTLVAEPFYPSGVVYVSTNGGVAWLSNNLPAGLQFVSFVSVASSADGAKLAGVYVGGVVYTSTDSGTTWVTNNIPTAAWYSIASSADGAKLTVVAGGGNNPAGPIFRSTNAGATWLPAST
ncbi:MAG: WD40/YVTN/BNR-like repeat-containing protein, partial [Limisphaerales bacterium]